MDYQLKHSPSGWTQVWRLWRHCCCRHGWFPLLVAPIVTGGMVLSVYSSLGCEFLSVDIGFTPSNFAWNQTSVDLGIFYYRGGSQDVSQYSRPFAPGCAAYTKDFDKSVISSDRVWKVTRVLATISGICSIIAAVSVRRMSARKHLYHSLPGCGIFWHQGNIVALRNNIPSNCLHLARLSSATFDCLISC